MKQIPKNGIKVLLPKSDSWWVNLTSTRCGGDPFLIFSEARAKELLAYEKEIKSMRKVAIENYRSVK